MTTTPSVQDSRASAATSGATLSLVWTRDGRTNPAPGAPGEILVTAEDALSRTLRARGPDGSALAMEMQRDVVDPGQLPAVWGSVGNAVLASIWKRRIAVARSVGTGGAVWPALLLCREKGLTFRPPSPLTGQPDALDECRDEDALRAARLPGWAQSTSRFLHDPSAPRDAPGTRLYTVASAPRGAGPEVGGWERFAKDLVRAIDLAPSKGTVEKLRERFPCTVCPEGPRCYGRVPSGGGGTLVAPLAPSRLVPIAFYPAALLVHREEKVDFGEEADLLGGARWSQWKTRHAPSWKHPALRSLREGLESEIAPRTGVVTPLEALRAKLQLFESTVEAALAHARAAGQPHLAISPATVLVHGLAPGKAGRYDVSLRGGMRGIPLEETQPAAAGTPIWLPPPSPVRPFAHDDLARAAEPAATAPPDGPAVHAGGFRHGRFAPVKLRAGRVWNDESRGAEFEIDVLGIDPTADVDPADRVRIVVDSDPWREIVLWARRDTERTIADGLALRALSVKLTSGNVLDLETSSRGRPLFGTAAVFRSYGAFYDIHALGMLLARALLENSRQPLDVVVRDALPVLTALCAAARRQGDRFEELVGVLENLSSAPPHDVLLSVVNVCHDPREAAAAADEVPKRVWAETLAVIASCVTHSRGASLCRTRRLETTSEALAKPYETLLERVRGILARLPAAGRAEKDASTRVVGDLAAAKSAAAVLDPREARVRELETALAAATARSERLQAELSELQKAVARREPVRDAQVVLDAGPWRRLHEALSGGSELPKQGELSVELVRTVLVEGLQTMSTLHMAVAELAGQEHAAEQRNLQRMVRSALRAAAQGSPASATELQAAATEIAAMRARLGSAVAMLVEAHGHASREGARKLLMTFSVAARKELQLTREQEGKLAELVQRIGGAVNELVGRLFDPAFQDRVRESLKRDHEKGRKA